MSAIPPTRPATARRPLGVMFKTVSEDCNLACDYCYYSGCAGRLRHPQALADGLLEQLIGDYMPRCGGRASFVWQGGEPLLAGLEFFQRVVELQGRHAPANTAIANAVQTNATLINDRWAAFFRAYGMLVGVSIDGPRALHDARRPDAAGHGSFERVMRGVGHLRRHGVAHNVLTVIHAGNVEAADALFAFYREQRFDHVQFIPCMDFRAQDPGAAPVYEIDADAWGRFLCRAFDLWYADGRPWLSVRLFDNLLAHYARAPVELCTHTARCPTTLVVERNGDVYPCDFYIGPDWRLGRIGSHDIDALLAAPALQAFEALRAQPPAACSGCRWWAQCQGGCPRNRPPGEAEVFCAAYQRLFAHAEARLARLGTAWRRLRFDAGARGLRGAPERNAPCPCGSGAKYKTCCARPG